jgi:hypothetical protein
MDIPAIVEYDISAAKQEISAPWQAYQENRAVWFEVWSDMLRMAR